MLNRGSEWRRWEPHIHSPGTILNNQFGGADGENRLVASRSRECEIATPQQTDSIVNSQQLHEIIQRLLKEKSLCPRKSGSSLAHHGASAAYGRKPRSSG
jgi:hypothetical protein